MTEQEQKEFIINFVQDWAGSKQAAIKWYKSEIIPALNKTVQQAVNSGDFEAVKQYLAHIEQDGFA